MLTTQYRMHLDIFQFPNERLYMEQIQTDVNINIQDIPILIEPDEADTDTRHSVIFVDLGNIKINQDEEKKASEDVEAAAVITKILLRRNPWLQEGDIGIIAVNRRQQRFIEGELIDIMDTDDSEVDSQVELESEVETKSKSRRKKPELIQIETVEGFQGREKPVIIFMSGFVSKEGHVVPLKHKSRVHVGLTRAQHLLVVVGHGQTLNGNEYWGEWFDWIHDPPNSKVGRTSLVRLKVDNGFN
jgi:superfamily I DNA and/or RNA helicase